MNANQQNYDFIALIVFWVMPVYVFLPCIFTMQLIKVRMAVVIEYPQP